MMIFICLLVGQVEEMLISGVLPIMSIVCLQLPSMLINQGQYTASSSTLNFIKIALMETAI